MRVGSWWSEISRSIYQLAEWSAQVISIQPSFNALQILTLHSKVTGMATTPQHFGIGIYKGKTWENVGALWRGAYQLGASYIFTIGPRYRRHPTDTEKSWLHIPLFQFESFEAFQTAAPHAAPLIAVEEGGTTLPAFEHPARAIYLLGAEDSGLPHEILARCHHRVSIPAVRKASYNVAIAGTLVMYDRLVKRGMHGGD